MNNCTFIGNLTRDPDIKFTQNNLSIANFSLAVDDPYVNKDGEEVKNTAFLDFVAFGYLADIFDKLNKGDRVIVAAAAKVESWEKDGHKRYKTVFRVKEAGVIKGKAATTTTKSKKAAAKAEEAPVGASGDDDIPF